MTAYSFSTGCRLKHKNYLALFDKTNCFNSYGEMNFAIRMHGCVKMNWLCWRWICFAKRIFFRMAALHVTN